MGQKPSELNNPFSSENFDEQPATDPSYESSPWTSEEEQTLPRTFMDDPTHQSEWNDCDVPVWTGDAEPKDNTSPPNPFVYEDDKAANATRRRNVILFGETGVGKSSIINLMAGAEVAKTSSNLEGCTLQAEKYSFTLPGEMSLCIYDTVGLNESEMGVNTFFGAIEKAHELITSLHATGGIDLLLFCIRGGRITATMERNYRLFSEFLCDKKVPLAFVVTHLECEDEMEGWWKRNEKNFEKYGMRSVAHACITAAPARVTTFAAKRAESCITLQRMLRDALNSPNGPYVRDVRSWFANLVETLRAFLMKRLPVSFRRRDLLNRLQTRCGLPPDEAQQLADMLARG